MALPSRLRPGIAIGSRSKVTVVSSVSRQQPSAGIRARLLNRGAYRWYLGTIFGLVYQTFEIVYIWTSPAATANKVTATLLLVVIYLGYIALPPLLWPQSVRARVIGLALYWVATLVLLPLIGVYLVWVWTLVVAMVAFMWMPLLPSLIVCAGVVIAQVILAATGGFEDGIVFAPFITVSVAVSLFAITRQIVANRELSAAHATIASLAAAEERARLARDLHDVLGHSLTVVAVKSELAGRLVERDPKRAIAEIADIEGLARTALTDLRAAVTSYREMNLDAELTAARTALDAAGIRSHLPLDAAVVDEDLSSLFGWVLREGITNVIRHSRATECWVDLTPSSLSVRDDGVGVPGDGNGNGLRGLTERALETGAILTTTNGKSGGFVLTATRSAG
jgi:two-component system, NarL family, sensor histidine kinase DesK